MSDHSAIYVDSLRESLRQVDRSLVWGMAAGLSVLSLSIATQGQAGEFSLGFGKFNGSFAFNLALAVYFVLGFVGASTVERVQRIARKLDPEIRSALKTFPSVATWSSAEIRFIAVILPAVCVAAGFVYARIQSIDSKPPPPEWSTVIMGTFILAMPYIIFAVMIAIQSSPFPDDGKQASQTKAEAAGQQSEKTA
jgi:hypothetical protein